MGCSGCSRRAERYMQDYNRRYSYLTNSQLMSRFNKFKESYCAGVIKCGIVENCTLEIYRQCRLRKEIFDVLV